MALDFIFQTDSNSRDQLIPDILSRTTQSVNSEVRDDRILAFTIQPVVASNGRTPWLPDWVNTDTFQLAIGLADQTPTSGTFKLTVNVTTTGLTALAYNVSAAALQTPLSAAFVAEGKSACTVTLLATGVYRVLANSNGAVTTGFLVGDPTNLNPTCSVFINEDSLGSASAPYDFLIALRQAPMCYATATTALPATGVSVATTQTGSSTQNRIQTISFTVTPTYDGTFAVSLVAGYQVPITGNTVATATVVTTSIEHGFVTGDIVSIPYNNGSTPTIAGSHVVTVLSSTTFSITVNVSVAGIGGVVEKDVTASCGVAWPTMDANDFALMLVNHSAVRYNSTDGSPDNIIVTKNGQNFQVQFTGTLGNSATPTLTCTNIDLIGAEGASGTLNLNTLSLYEYSLTQTAETFDLLFSITRTRASGEVRTVLGPTAITIFKDLIDLSTMVPTPLPSYYTAAYIDAHFPGLGIANNLTGANTFTTSGGVAFTVDGTGNVVVTTTGAVAFIGPSSFQVDGATPATLQNLRGTTTNDDATAGGIGEYTSSLVASGSATALTSTVAKNITSISLTAGDWDVEGSINYTLTAASVTQKQGGLSSTSATLPTDGTEVYNGVQSTLLTDLDGQALPRKRFSLSGTTSVYLVAKATFAAGSVSVFGAINARRAR